MIYGESCYRTVSSPLSCPKAPLQHSEYHTAQIGELGAASVILKEKKSNIQYKCTKLNVISCYPCKVLLPKQIFTTQILRIKVLNVLQYMLKHVCTQALGIFINKRLFYTCIPVQFDREK